MAGRPNESENKKVDTSFIKEKDNEQLFFKEELFKEIMARSSKTFYSVLLRRCYKQRSKSKDMTYFFEEDADKFGYRIISLR